MAKYGFLVEVTSKVKFIKKVKVIIKVIKFKK